MTRAIRFIGGLAFLATCGCSDEPRSPSGTAEGFRVRDAQFIDGPLPGEHPLDGGLTGSDGGTSGRPSVRRGALPSLTFTEGQASAQFSGWAGKGALSVGLALEGTSTGYWIVPVGPEDKDANNDPTWKASVDIGESIPVGQNVLRIVAFDEDGRAGLQDVSEICVSSKVFDNLHICAPNSPKHQVPKAVISLTWDTQADVDLQVRIPGGRLVEPKNPFTVDSDGGKPPDDVGYIDRDSNRACAIDGIRTENLVWQNEKPHGTFDVFANLYDSCKQPSVRFVASVYVAAEGKDGTETLKLIGSQAGELLDFQANGGAARGLFVTSVTLK